MIITSDNPRVRFSIDQLKKLEVDLTNQCQLFGLFGHKTKDYVARPMYLVFMEDPTLAPHQLRIMVAYTLLGEGSVMFTKSLLDFMDKYQRRGSTPPAPASP